MRQRLLELTRMYPVRQSQVEVLLLRVLLRLGLQVRQVEPLMQVEQRERQGAHSPLEFW